jgi:hypothetical protein
MFPTILCQIKSASNDPCFKPCCFSTNIYRLIKSETIFDEVDSKLIYENIFTAYSNDRALYLNICLVVNSIQMKYNVHS